MIFYTLIFFLAIMVATNLLLFRPKRKSFNKRAVMLNSIRTGTVVYTLDGIRGKVDAVNKGILKISCYPDNVKLIVDLETVDRIENYNEQYAKYMMDEKIRKGRENIKRRKLRDQINGMKKKKKTAEKSQNE
ncbi:preprotein translocase subunit YajC [Mediterraneibacter massiliensis]|jgi:preprotein translocase YajC subunit|uniref:preprotein translocase subunit YajC n=1 Tax=Mediterraneibacter massiliensis TaxID=1720300 RepID=UPI0022E8BCBE|nr:preprotein translocase subunit YajC [Mediterraneibacter massiliensis]